MQHLLGFKLEPPVEPQRGKLTLGAQAWQGQQTKNQTTKRQICGKKPSQKHSLCKSQHIAYFSNTKWFILRQKFKSIN